MHLLGHGELPIPNGLDPCLVKEKINSELMDLGCRGDVSMHAYGNKDTFSDDELLSKFSNAEIKIDLLPEGDILLLLFFVLGLFFS